MRHVALLVLLCVVSASVCAGEEKIRGLLEKTAKPEACAQITDALADVYYIKKTDEAEKAVAKYLGKNEKVVITGTVEAKEGDAAPFFNLKLVEPYVPKMPPAPPPPPAPEAKTDTKTGDAKPADTKAATPAAPAPATKAEAKTGESKPATEKPKDEKPATPPEKAAK
ncbi:MAG: hypothetical protein NTW87_28215 [Planctomycetota bacterium]|nr:hypothetical protein [Planctomycetota bacterium]